MMDFTPMIRLCYVKDGDFFDVIKVPNPLLLSPPKGRSSRVGLT